MMEQGSPPALTPLDGLHRSLGGRMVPFADYLLPVQYPPGILAEHQHTRTHASLFDVSHMGRIVLSGPDAAAALESLVPADVVGLAGGRQRYTFFTNEAGGIDDDLMVARIDDQLHLIVNASRKHADSAWLQGRIGDRCRIAAHFDQALLALQGPRAVDAMAAIAPAAADLDFMTAMRARWEGIDLIVSRSGYTGEDGFEIGVAGTHAEVLARRLLEHAAVKPAGLGARDSLRLEAGLCLHGHDIDARTTPVEARLAWAIPKVRRTGGERAAGFPGASVILEQLDNGAPRHRVGLLPEGRAPVREGEVLHDADGAEAGRVTSGGFGATANRPIAMALVAPRCAVPGTRLVAIVRNQPRPCEVVALPFVPHRYFRRTTR